MKCDCCGKKVEILYIIPHYELEDDNIMTFNHDQQQLCADCAERLCNLINGFSKCCGKKED